MRPPRHNPLPTRLWPLLCSVASLALPGHAGDLTRVANDTLALPPALPSGTYEAVDAFPGLLFFDPLAFATPLGESHRLFVVEQTGRVSVIPDLDSPDRETFLDITARVRSNGNEEGLLGLAFHPNYHVAGQPGHRHFYVCYMTTVGTLRHWRLSRFSVQADDPNRGDPDSEVHLITQLDTRANHNGGDLHFGEDGYLYVSTGDEGGGGDPDDNGQRIDKNFFAAVLRLDVDRLQGNHDPNPHAAIHPGTYRVPADNPFVGATHFNGLPVDPASVRTEFWAIGLRNPWRMSFDRPTGRLFVADVGQSAREEINILSPEVFASNGGVPNYGWSFREGTIAFTTGPGGATPPLGFSAIEPIHDYPNPGQGRSVTGGLLYRGSRYPELSGAYLFADYVTGRIWAMSDPGGPAQAVEQIATRIQIAAFGLNPATGDVLLARDNSNRAADDPVLRLERSTAGGQEPPQLLSETGAFRSLATLEPEDGIVPYEINAPFWSDHALKRRWFSIPDPAARMDWSQDGDWSFPAGQVWIKHFELDLDRDAPGTQRVRLETRFLVKTDDDVYGLTYRWNEAQTEAFLVGEEGESVDYPVIEGGSARIQTWRFPSRSDCRTCHNPAAGWALGFNTRQLNRVADHGAGPLDQLAALSDAGYFENPLPPSVGLPAHAPPHDPSFPLEARARAYLASNCVACHQSGSFGMGVWSARPELSLADSGLLNSPLINNAGDPLKRTLVPGDPERSMILERMRTPRSGTSPLAPMPPLASNEIDEEGLALLEEWLAEGSSLHPAPSGFSASGGLHLDRVVLAWTEVEGAGGYTVYRGAGEDFAEAEALANVAAEGSPQYDDEATEPGAVWRYWVTATLGEVESAPAGPAVGWRSLVPPSAPEASTDGPEHGIALSWIASPDATAYRILRHTDDNIAAAVEVGTTASTSWLDASAEAGTDYHYWIVATNAHGESAPTAGTAGRRFLAIRQPDLMIGRSPAHRIGEGVFQGAGGQTLSLVSRRRRPFTAHYLLRNAGNASDTYRLFATRGNARFAVAYFSDAPQSANVTAAVVGGTHFIGPLEVAASEPGRIRVRPAARLRRDRRVRRIVVTLWALSSSEAARNDRVVLRATSRR